MGETDKDVLIALIGLAGAVLPSLISLFAGRQKDAAAPGGVRFGQWVVLIAVATGLSGLLAVQVGQIGMGLSDQTGLPPDVANWAFFGGLVGAAQWRALRVAGANPRLWVIASVIGWTPCAFFVGQPWAWPVFGALTALAQSVLCPRTVLRPVAWIATNALAWFLGGAVSLIAGMALLPGFGFAGAWVIGWALLGLVAGIVTGLVARFVLFHGAQATPGTA